jgi:CheY-like chemotaxis protein
MSTPPSILVIDDDVDVRESIVDILESRGYRVLAATHGLEAIFLLQQGRERPDLILLDMLMPVMDGWAFRAEQRKMPEAATIPVVVTSAYGLPPERTRDLDAAAILRKPFEMNALVEMVESVAGAPA